ncbi:MAG TPA: hypothetical protein VG076_13370 [Acidimicrobiales bacterium]|jgi:hypothetical protein|nr:hypothetical protein [Acidimicrobiales bacterium]
MRRLAAVGVVALLLAACGGGGSSAALTLVRDAPKKTTDAGTSRLEVLIERPQAQGGPAAPIKITGEADYQAHRGHMLIDLSQFGLPGPPIDAVFDNVTVYEKFPAALGAALPAGKSWVKVDLATAGKNVGVDVGSLSQAQAGDPSQTLDYLRGASDNVTRVGTEDVRGTQTTHYKVVVDLNKAAEASPTAKDAIRSAIKLLGSSTQPLDLWVDAQGRVRQMKYTVDLSKSKVATSTPDVPGSVTFTLNLFDFGIPVQAQVPPPEQVVDLSALTGGK